MGLRFAKMHGAGNNYLFIDARAEQRDWPALAVQMSDRNFGVGSDGIILVQQPGAPKAALRMRIFNADGSEAEMCGNGIRCFAKFAIERGIVAGQPRSLAVETGAGLLDVFPKYENGRVTAARVMMGKPRLMPSEVPVDVPGEPVSGAPLIDEPLVIDGIPIRFTAVSMGNPHAVAFITTPVKEFDLHRIGPKVEHHPYFPKRVNFEIVNLRSRGHAVARVWERGSGETMACGTGACAIAVAASLKDLADDVLHVELPGGTLTIEWDGAGPVWMEGPCVEVCEGEWKAA